MTLTRPALRRAISVDGPRCTGPPASRSASGSSTWWSRGPVRRWSWTASAAGVRLTLLHTVEATAGGTRTGLTIEGFAPAVAAYLPAAWWAMRRLVH